eukprot:gene2178-5198_t
MQVIIFVLLILTVTRRRYSTFAQPHIIASYNDSQTVVSGPLGKLFLQKGVTSLESICSVHDANSNFTISLSQHVKEVTVIFCKQSDAQLEIEVCPSCRLIVHLESVTSRISTFTATLQNPSNGFTRWPFWQDRTAYLASINPCTLKHQRFLLDLSFLEDGLEIINANLKMTTYHNQECALNDPYEPNNIVPSEVFAFNCAPASISASICSYDKDWYEIPICEKCSIAITVDFVHADTDIDISLWSSDGSLMMTSTSLENSEKILYENLKDMTFMYLLVYTEEETVKPSIYHANMIVHASDGSQLNISAAHTTTNPPFTLSSSSADIFTINNTSTDPITGRLTTINEIFTTQIKHTDSSDMNPHWFRIGNWEYR